MTIERQPASPDVFCPKCLAANHGLAITVWAVHDATGRYFQCDGCGRAWLGENPDRLNAKGRPVR